jgi:hypothetical protein
MTYLFGHDIREFSNSGSFTLDKWGGGVILGRVSRNREQTKAVWERGFGIEGNFKRF